MKRRCVCIAGMMALFLSVAPVWATTINVQIDQVSAGVNGDSYMQYIVLRFLGPGDNLWGPQSSENASRLKLVFYDAADTEIGEFDFPSDPPINVQDPVRLNYPVLIATQDFADWPGMPTPDFVIPRDLLAVDGKMCVRGNSDNPNAPAINLCLSYGNFVGDTESDTLNQPAGLPATGLLITDTHALKRSANFNNYGAGQFNADFSLSATPWPRNTAGVMASIPLLSQVIQGENLFKKETFQGNGRTCFHCHRPSDGMGLNTTTISFLPPTDKLFVAEHSPALSGLENPCIMHGARGLILENIDGFGNPPVYRGSPHLMNLALTAPYGLSGEFADLQTFALTAVKQHAPKTLTRNSNPNNGPLDFRLPTSAELAALETFMQSLRLPADSDYDLDRMIAAAVTRGGDSASIQRGKALFFGTNQTASQAKCFLCHSGPVLADADMSLGGGNQKFNTGVVNLPINNFLDACLGGISLPAEANGTREFSTPPLIGVSMTAPYFHDNSVQTLRESVGFYTGNEFNNSPAAQNPLIGMISIDPQDIDDITHFLEALVEPTVQDCNSNTIDDIIDLNNGTSDNCNQNRSPDECDLVNDDCNGNLVPDECDLVPLKFLSATDHTVTAAGLHITSADIDGDGDIDLINAGWVADNVEVLLNDGTGTFTSAGTSLAGSLPRWTAVADFNGDGYPDIIVANLFSDYLSLLLNNGVDNSHVWQGLASAITIPMNAPNQFDGSTDCVLAADLNGDGLIDIAALKRFSSKIAILINNGKDGNNVWQGFANPVDYNNGDGIVPVAIMAGHLNADSALDLVVANEFSNDITVLLNSGNGTFPTAVNVNAGNSPESVAVADFDGDFIDDVAVPNFTSDLITILHNNGSGVLGSPTTIVVGSYPFGAGPNAILPYDIDKDHDFDLVVSNNISKNISVLLNNGSGSFTRLINLPLDAASDNLTVADLNGTGGADIAVVRFFSSDISLLENITPPFGGDCNQNGVPDACDVMSQNSADINGNGVPDECEHLGDIDNDGDVDLIDADLLIAVLMETENRSGFVLRADLTTDGKCDGRDVQVFVQAIQAAN